MSDAELVPVAIRIESDNLGHKRALRSAELPTAQAPDFRYSIVNPFHHHPPTTTTTTTMMLDEDEPFSEEEEQVDEVEKPADDAGDELDSDPEEDFEDEEDGDEVEVEMEDEEAVEAGEEEEEEEEEAVDEIPGPEGNIKTVDKVLLQKAKRVRDKNRRKKLKEFVDDEAELSGDEVFSEDEADSSGDDEKVDTELVDLEAKELDSDEEEDVRRLYHKQIATEDRRALLLLQEQLEENQVVGQQRRRKFKWQTRELMEKSMKRHYDPDDDDSQGTDDEDDDIDYSDFEPRLKRPTAEALLLGNPRLLAASENQFYDNDDDDESDIEIPRKGDKYADGPVAGPSTAMSDDSNSNLISSRLAHGPTRAVTSTKNVDLNKFLFRDKELVQALSTKETIIATREEKERTIQRELKRVLQSKSIFDQLYS